MTDELSPEEKLLRLIKGEKASPKSAAGEKTPAAAARTMDGIVPQASAPKAALAIPYRVQAWTEKLHTELEFLPKIFLGVSLALALLIAFNIINDRVQAHKKLNRLWLAGSHASPTEKTSSLLSAVKESAVALPDKDLFKFLEASPSAPSRTNSPDRVTSLNSLLANYTLSGIIGGDQPQAIIEDKKEGKTFFLNVGDTLGDIRIIAIEEGKVIVAVGNEQAELNL